MARFFDPESASGGKDQRLHAPATARNRDVIFDVLAPHIQEGTVLELASGTGEHAAHMAPQLPHITWQPTDIADHHITSINAWREHADGDNILPAIHLDATHDVWPLDHLEAPISTIMAVNLIHISPWIVTESLINRAGEVLETGHTLFFYGPYKRGGAHTSESNVAFDTSLKSNNPAWGVRDMEAVADLASDAKFEAPDVHPMPANNFSLVFKKL